MLRELARERAHGARVQRLAELARERPRAGSARQRLAVLARLLEGLQRLVVVAHIAVRPAQRIVAHHPPQPRGDARHLQRDVRRDQPRPAKAGAWMTARRAKLAGSASARRAVRDARRSGRSSKGPCANGPAGGGRRVRRRASGASRTFSRSAIGRWMMPAGRPSQGGPADARPPTEAGGLRSPRQRSGQRGFPSPSPTTRGRRDFRRSPTNLRLRTKLPPSTPRLHLLFAFRAVRRRGALAVLSRVERRATRNREGRVSAIRGHPEV